MVRFWNADDGNVASIFALAVIPIFGLFGAAVDYGRATDVRTKLQIAVDSTALVLSREPPGTTAAQLTSKGYPHFKAVYDALVQHEEAPAPGQKLPDGPSNYVFDVTPSTNGPGTLFIRASTYVPVTMMSLVTSKIDVAAQTEVKWGKAKLEVMLALDNTGSMSSNSKMTKLKEAATNLVNTLAAAASKPGDVKIGLVPFDIQVNIGTEYKDKSWIKYGVANRAGEYVDTAEAWNGCVMDRDQSKDVTDTAPTADITTKFPASPCRTTSLAKMMPLTMDWNALKSRIQTMQPSGNTNVAIGLEWAWHNLTLNEPMTAVGTSTADEPLEKTIILLTDGDNTENRWSTSRSSIDGRTKTACTNAKAAGMVIYTIRVINGNKSLLQNCASDASKYFEVTDSSQLIQVFSTIAGNLAKLHLSR